MKCTLTSTVQGIFAGFFLLVVFAEGQSYNLTQLALKKSFTTKITTQTDVIKPFETVNGAKVFSLTSVVSSSVGLISLGTVCILMAILSLLAMPSLIYRVVKDYRKAKRKRQEEIDQAEDAAKRVQRDLNRQDNGRAKKDDEEAKKEEDEEIVFSKRERWTAIVCFSFSTIFILLFTCIGFASHILLDNAWYEVSDLAPAAIGSMRTFAGSLNDVVGQYASTAGLSAMVASSTPLDQTALDNNLYATMRDLTSRYSNLSLALDASLRALAVNMDALAVAVALLQNETQSLNAYLTSTSSTTGVYALLQQNRVSTADGISYNVSTATLNSANLPTLLLDISYSQNSVLTTAVSTARSLVSSFDLTTYRNTIVNLSSIVETRLRNRVTDTASSSLNTFSASLTNASNTVYNTVNTFLLNGQVQAMTTLPAANRYNAMIGLATNICLITALTSVILTTTFVIFDQKTMASAMNVVNLTLAILFWLLCAVAVLYAVMDSSLCADISAPSLADRFKIMKDGFTYPNYTQLASSIQDARASCYNGKTSDLVNFAIDFSQKRVRFTDESNTMLNLARSGNDMTTYLLNAISATWDQSQVIGNLSDMSVALRSLNVRQENNRNGPFLTSLAENAYKVNFGVYQNLATSPLFYIHPAITLNTTLTSFASALTSAQFNMNLAGVLAGNQAAVRSRVISEFNTTVIRAIMSNTTTQINTLVASIQNRQTTILTLNSAIGVLVQDVQDKVAQLFQVYTTTTDTQLSSDTSRSAMKTTTSSAYSQVLAPVSAAIANQFQNAGDCEQIGIYGYRAENLVCQQVLAGADMSYFCLGALASLLLMYVISTRWCVQRLNDDMRWAIMATLLKRQYPEDDKSKARLLKSQAISHVDDQDFTVQFTPDIASAI